MNTKASKALFLLIIFIFGGSSILAEGRSSINIDVKINKNRIIQYESVIIKVIIYNDTNKKVETNIPLKEYEKQTSKFIFYSLDGSEYSKWRGPGYGVFRNQKSETYTLEPGENKVFLQHIFWQKSEDIFSETGKYRFRVKVPSISYESEPQIVHVSAGSKNDEKILAQLKQKRLHPLLSQGSYWFYQKQWEKFNLKKRISSGTADIESFKKDYNPYRKKDAKYLLRLVDKYSDSNYANDILRALLDVCICSRLNKSNKNNPWSIDLPIKMFIHRNCEEKYMTSDRWYQEDLIREIYKKSKNISEKYNEYGLYLYLAILDGISSQKDIKKRLSFLREKELNPILEYKVEVLSRRFR